MSALLRLYPRAWRERYGDELLALLEDRPASPLDLVDLARGAFDARLHPQLPGTEPATPERKNPMSDRLPGVAAIGGRRTRPRVPVDRCVSGSKERTDSTSSNPSSIRTGSARFGGKTSTRPPRTARSPHSVTRSARA